jgi:hypothetical protein
VSQCRRLPTITLIGKSNFASAVARSDRVQVVKQFHRQRGVLPGLPQRLRSMQPIRGYPVGSYLIKPPLHPAINSLALMIPSLSVSNVVKSTVVFLAWRRPAHHLQCRPEQSQLMAPVAFLHCLLPMLAAQDNRLMNAPISVERGCDPVPLTPLVSLITASHRQHLARLQRS